MQNDTKIFKTVFGLMALCLSLNVLSHPHEPCEIKKSKVKPLPPLATYKQRQEHMWSLYQEQQRDDALRQECLLKEHQKQIKKEEQQRKKILDAHIKEYDIKPLH